MGLIDFIPIVGTISHWVADPKGINPGDYSAPADFQQLCAADVAEAERRCKAAIDLQQAAYMRDFAGLGALGADLVKAAFWAAMVAKFAATKGGKIITGVVGVVDVAADLGAYAYQWHRMGEASKQAKQTLCVCG
jgi:hypothetical protein